MSLSRNVTGREFQRQGPATEKLLSPRWVRVLVVAHVKTSADRSDRRPMSVKSWQSSARYYGSWPCNALYTRTASLKSMRCQTGNQCSSLRTGDWYAPVFQFSWSVVLGWVTVFGRAYHLAMEQATQANSASYPLWNGKWVPAKMR